MVCMQEEKRQEERQACYFWAAHPTEAKQYLIRKVGSLKSSFTFITSGVPIFFQTKLVTHSVMLFFISETVLLNVLQESSDTISRSCTNDLQSHRTHWQSKPISAHRVTDCLTQINNRRDSSSSGIVLVSFYKRPPDRKEVEEILLQYEEKGTQVKAHTAEWFSKQKTMTPPSSWPSMKRRSAKFLQKKVFLHMWRIHAGI